MYHSMLTTVKNAQAAGKRSAVVPFSNANMAVLGVLEAAGYIKEAEKKTAGKKSFIDVKLAYSGNEPRISGIKIKSRPSRHIYIKAGGLRPVRQGYGLSVISTSRGVMSGREAKKLGVGGEHLFDIW